MKVGATGGLATNQPSTPRAGAGPAAGFAVQSGEGVGDAAAAARAGSVLGVSSIDALLALQEVGGALERRKRAVRRAGVILDVLDELKIAVLDGAVPARTLGRLIEAVRQQRARTGDAGLEGVLDEIETRAAVELAKLEQNTA